MQEENVETPKNALTSLEEEITAKNGNHDGIQQEEHKEGDEDDNHEDDMLDIKAKSFMVEDFEIAVFKEEAGCIHEIVTPKGYKRTTSRSSLF